MSNKTAVEILQEYLAISLGPDRMRLLYNEFDKAKKLEAKQHREKWQEGWNDAFELVENSRQQSLNIGKHE
jgi:hypothetical protein